jgi:Tol biopolymer transport system component
MTKERRISFTGTGFQALGWSLYSNLLSIPIIPAAWGAAALYRWLIRNLTFDDDTKASFEGQGGQVWGYFALSALLGYVPLLFRTAEDTTTISFISFGFSILMLPISAALGIRIMRWLFANIKFSDGTNLNFIGSYAPYLGWLLLNSLSVFTIIGWAWVSTAFLRWLCRNIEAGQNKIEFFGSGWGLLWRSFVAILLSVFIIPIPWIWLWVLRWGISNIVIRQETTSLESTKPKKKVFFCFTREDISRAEVVKKYWESEENGTAGFSNPTELMNLEKQGGDAIKHRIVEQLEGTDMTVVLVGKETCTDPWVKFAIEKSIEKGNGLLGIDISKIKDLHGNTSERCGKIPEGFPFYYWNKDDGKTNIAEWIKNSGNQPSVKKEPEKPPEKIIPEKCPGCGKVVETGWSHCGYCGQKVNAVQYLAAQEKATPVEVPPLIPIPPNLVKPVEHSKHKTWIWIIGVISIVLIALLLIFVVFRKDTIDNGVKPSLTNPGALAAESTPRIVFDTSRDGNMEIYMMNADGSAPINLSNNQAADESPVWSPDGQKIAFVSNREGVYQVYVMNPDGSNQTRLTNGQAENALPSWSPDGKRIAYQSIQDGNWEIYVMDADGTNQTRLTNLQANDGGPSWSADGSKITFVSDRDGSLGIYAMKADGSDQTSIMSNSWIDSTPDWSPDGKRIVFTSDRDGNYEIYVMNADGSDQTRLTNNQVDDSHPSWSADGQKIVFVSSRDGNYEIYSMKADGSGQTRITTDPAEDGYPDWSPGSGTAFQTVLPTTRSTEAIPFTPANASAPADVQALADQYFESGAKVYIYDPHPASVALSALNSTEFSFRYILAENATAVPNIVLIWRVNSAGVKEYLVSDRSYVTDWESKNGYLTFSMFTMYRDIYRQGYTYTPDQAVLQAVVGMTPLYGGLNEFYVDDPIYLDVFLMSPVEQDGSLLLTDASTPLSNEVRIEITP